MQAAGERRGEHRHAPRARKMLSPGLSTGGDGPTSFLPRIPHGFSARNRILICGGSIRVYSGAVGLLGVPWPANRRESPARIARSWLVTFCQPADQIGPPVQKAARREARGLMPHAAGIGSFNRAPQARAGLGRDPDTWAEPRAVGRHGGRSRLRIVISAFPPFASYRPGPPS